MIAPLQRVRRSQAGLTIAEVLVYLVISLILMGGVYALIINQGRAYQSQLEVTDVRNSVRGAASLLTWELRQASAASGDLYFVTTDSFAVRSIQASGILCSEHPTLTRYGLSVTAGEFNATADDSALVFKAAGAGVADDGWKTVRITNIYKPASLGGVLNCFWGDATAGKGRGKTTVPPNGVASTTGTTVPDLGVEVTGLPAATYIDSVYVGAPFLAFRRIQYGIYQEAGRWWLGRKVGGAVAYEKLTGPLRAPVDGGLVFVYRDAAGAVTANKALVAEVEIIIRGESWGQAPNVLRSPAVAFRRDTVRTRVALRG